MNEREKEILRECQGGNTSRFGLLYEDYVRRVYRFIYFKTLHRETAEDLTSDVFFRALKHIRRVDPERGLASWLYRIAQNAVIDYFRTRKLGRNIEDIWDLADGNDFIDHLDDARTFEKAREHLSALTPVQRAIVVMRIWEEMSYKEIAEIVGKSETNCKVLFFRALTAVRSEMLLPLLVLLFGNVR